MQVRDALYVDGSWAGSSGRETIDVIDATTEDVVGRVPSGTVDDIDRAVQAAARAFPAWSATPVAERARLLGLVADRLEARADEIAAVVSHEVGTTLAYSVDTQAGLPIKDVRTIAQLLPTYEWEEPVGPSLVVRESVGVVGAITPWNYPLHQMTAKIAPALGAGCTVVVKPSGLAPLTAFLLADIADEVGIPRGVVNVVSGEGAVIGEAMASHPLVDMISLTGSTRAGTRVMQLAAETIKRVALELGGKSATIVLDDVDLETVVPQAITGCFRNSGQNCSALTRLIVPRRDLGRVEELATAATEGWQPGDPFDPTVKLGPLVSADQRRKVQGHIQSGVDEGARLVTGGPDRPAGLDHGFFVRPTVFSGVESGMAIAQEEIFGPVLVILAYDDEDDAIRIANDSQYGLSGAVWSGDPARAEGVARRMRTGRVVVNGGAFNPAAPFGGYKRSGIGRELGRFGLEEFLEVKTLQR
jgi:acyl-CoA reductase-like NAD-dependent aldehyde dehydrogenase